MTEKVGSCRLDRLTVCLNTTALALVRKVSTKFNVSLSLSLSRSFGALFFPVTDFGELRLFVRVSGCMLSLHARCQYL